VNCVFKLNNSKMFSLDLFDNMHDFDNMYDFDHPVFMNIVRKK